VDCAVERRVDLFLHAGDLFDRPDPRNAERRFVASQVRRLLDAGVRVLAIAGNHDSPRSAGYDGGVSPHEELEALGAVRLLRRADSLQSELLTIRDITVRVRGASSDFNLPADACPLRDLLRPDECSTRAADVEIVLLHYGVEGLSEFDGEPHLSLQSLGRLGADAICVGHLHCRAEHRLKDGALLLNPGATEHIHFGEEALDCGFWFLRFEPGRADADYVRVPTQPMRTLSIDVGEAAAPILPDAAGAGLTGELLRRIEQASRPGQLLRVRLAGQIERTRFHELDLGALMAAGAALNFHCRIDSDALAVYDRIADLHVEVGFSFDVRAELQSVASALARDYGDNGLEREICVDAAREIAEVYDRMTGGVR
jgi:predicted phosphodiesterase